MIKKKLFYVSPEMDFGGTVVGCQMMTTSTTIGVSDLSEDNTNEGVFFD